MIQHIPADKRFFSDFGWLKTYWLFAFDTYYDPANLHWGVLRVFNDDVIEAGKGFGMHPHRDMEIVTIVHSGELTHQDSVGNKGVIRPGDVQRMSAGTGIQHSEFNYGKEPVSLFQIWLLPRERGIKPDYAQTNFGDIPRNVLRPLASGNPSHDALPMHTHATIYTGAWDKGYREVYETEPERRIFIYVAEGSLSVNTTFLQRRDQARLKDEPRITLEATSDASFILIDAAAQA
jgi:quercetin 2,3-dioxygenase